MKLGKFQRKYCWCGKPGHIVQDCRVKLNAAKGVMQGRAKLHAVLGKQKDKLSSSTATQRITVLEKKLGKIAAHLWAKNQ